MGYSFKSRTSNTLTISLFDKQEQEWEVLCELPFDSRRKRMSLLVRNPVTEQHMLMTKGADSIMIPRLTADHYEVDELKKNLHMFAV